MKKWGREDVAGEEEVEKVCIALPFPGRWHKTTILRKHLSPLSLPPTIMDTKHISFKERPDTATLYLIVDFKIQERVNTFQFTMSVTCTN